MLIALDIGNVCVQLNILESNRALGFDPETPLPDALTDILRDYELGKIQTSGFLTRLSRLTGLTESAVTEAWAMRIGETMPGMTEAIYEFSKQGVEFVFLSDTNELNLTKVRRTLTFINLVKDGIFSFQVGSLKPQPEIYASFEKKFGIPDLYFDDLEKNIIGAKNRNWNAVQFFDPIQFRKTVEQFLAERQ